MKKQKYPVISYLIWQRAKTIREWQKLTQKDVAARLGIAQQRYSDWEREWNYLHALFTVGQLANALLVHTGLLTGEKTIRDCENGVYERTVYTSTLQLAKILGNVRHDVQERFAAMTVFEWVKACFSAKLPGCFTFAINYYINEARHLVDKSGAPDA